MIGALRGTIYLKSQNSVILFVRDVGYAVYVTNRFLEKTKTGSETFLFIHSHIREDAFDLFGFPTQQELHIFTLLLTVSGIGPKTALTIVDRGVSAVTGAVQRSDVNFFTTIPRLGKKNAQKIIIELKQKLGSINELDLSEYTSSETKEILEALSAMGFVRHETIQVIKTLPTDMVTIEQKIRYCLKELGKTT